ncbi:metallopeptidase family protein [Yinghuangia aomiensis]
MPSWFGEDVLAGVISRALWQAAAVPDDVQVGYHLCYGDVEEQHFVQPADAGHLADVLGGILAAAPRPVNWVHLPVPIERDDEAYFAPLAWVDVPEGTELYLGLLHHEDGVEGARRRAAAAATAVTTFGVGTECGFGRGPSDRTPSSSTCTPPWPRPGDAVVSLSLDAEAFEALVADELDELPDEMVDGLDNVVIVVEDRPEDGSLDLLGLYDGVALTERGAYGFGEMPDRIVLYREPLLAIVESEDELRDEIHIHARARDRALLRHRRRAPARTGLGVAARPALPRLRLRSRRSTRRPCPGPPGRSRAGRSGRPPDADPRRRAPRPPRTRTWTRGPPRRRSRRCARPPRRPPGSGGPSGLPGVRRRIRRCTRGPVVRRS